MNTEAKSSSRKNQSRLFIYIPTELYDTLKEHCKDRSMTMTKYVMNSLVARLKMEMKQQVKH
jgi:hypothetical protein